MRLDVRFLSRCPGMLFCFSEYSQFIYVFVYLLFSFRHLSTHLNGRNLALSVGLLDSLKNLVSIFTSSVLSMIPEHLQNYLRKVQ